MATDKAHHMDIFGKQEMGWVVPLPLDPNQTVNVSDWADSKLDIGEIHWQQPDGTPYVLSAANGNQNIHNAEAYMAKLPSRLLIDPAKVPGAATIRPYAPWTTSWMVATSRCLAIGKAGTMMRKRLLPVRKVTRQTPHRP
jgi:hypothetical protein